MIEKENSLRERYAKALKVENLPKKRVCTTVDVDANLLGSSISQERNEIRDRNTDLGRFLSNFTNSRSLAARENSSSTIERGTFNQEENLRRLREIGFEKSIYLQKFRSVMASAALSHNSIGSIY
eukprot:TRINITY_DN8276_c0_g1_i5.p1 TRINITY_DN8276_c0_g1~~TRINITY_DN8276_c0_g1_i5.p1  ORF type:complete len:125 (+),score=14.82 TRINITY_DN8276_c0_g1_i5:432-806(+)